VSSAGGRPKRLNWSLVSLGFLGVAGLTVLLLSLLTNIFERKQEARQAFVRVVEVTEGTMDPKVWGQNWPFQYDSYLKTVDRPSRSSTRNPGSAASSPGTPSPWTIAIAGATPTGSSIRTKRAV
jgi:nitrite reductase (cytochrome c-552)